MRSERMVEQVFGPPVISIGCPGYQDDWEVFGVGAADRVER